MRKKGLLISAAGGLVAAVVGFALYAYYDFTHNVRIPLTAQQISNAQIAFKGAMGEGRRTSERYPWETPAGCRLRSTIVTPYQGTSPFVINTYTNARAESFGARTVCYRVHGRGLLLW